MEDKIGTIEDGKLADLVVLDRDYLTVTDEELKRIKPILTTVGGDIVHDSGDLTRRPCTPGPQPSDIAAEMPFWADSQGQPFLRYVKVRRWRVSRGKRERGSHPATAPVARRPTYAARAGCVRSRSAGRR